MGWVGRARELRRPSNKVESACAEYNPDGDFELPSASSPMVQLHAPPHAEPHIQQNQPAPSARPAAPPKFRLGQITLSMLRSRVSVHGVIVSTGGVKPTCRDGSHNYSASYFIVDQGDNPLPFLVIIFGTTHLPLCHHIWLYYCLPC